MVDKELITFQEFISFAYDMLGKKNKQVSNLYTLVVKSKLTSQHIDDVKKSFSRCFSHLQGDEWTTFTGNNYIQYKTGTLSLGELQKKCKSDEDQQVFNEYIKAIKAIYTDLKKTLFDFFKKLELDENSVEAKFLSRILNEFGTDLIDDLVQNQKNLNMESLMAKGYTLLQSGKLTNIFEDIKDKDFKFSKILKALTRVLESYENQ